MHILGNLFRDNIKTVIPIVAVVLVLNFTLVPLGFTAMARFVVGSVLIVIGLSLFLFGVEIGITPMGSLTGS